MLAARERAAHFQSLDMLQSQRNKHVRPAHGPRDVFSAPLTQTQAVGWQADAAPLGETVRHPKKHCAETKFAAALYSSGYL